MRDVVRQLTCDTSSAECGRSAYPGGLAGMNNNSTGSIWQMSRIKLEQQLWAQIAADMHACALGRQCSQTMPKGGYG
jgi:hypothetical protein